MTANKALWEDVEGNATAIFDVRAFDVDMEWGKRAWTILSKTPLVNYSGPQGYYEILVKLFCLGEIVHIFNDLHMDERYDKYDEYTEWVDECELTKLRFVLLAGEEYYEDSYISEWGEISEVIDNLIEKEYSTVVEWLVAGFGGKELMLNYLVNPEREDDEDIDYPDNAQLFDWMNSGYPRNFI